MRGQWVYFNIHFPSTSSTEHGEHRFFISPLSFGSAPFVHTGRLLTARAALIVWCGKVSIVSGPFCKLKSIWQNCWKITYPYSDLNRKNRNVWIRLSSSSLFPWLNHSTQLLLWFANCPFWASILKCTAPTKSLWRCHVLRRMVTNPKMFWQGIWVYEYMLCTLALIKNVYPSSTVLIYKKPLYLAIFKESYSFIVSAWENGGLDLFMQILTTFLAGCIMTSHNSCNCT